VDELLLTIHFVFISVNNQNLLVHPNCMTLGKNSTGPAWDKANKMEPSGITVRYKGCGVNEGWSQGIGIVN
jgi:hypothetical protein